MEASVSSGPYMDPAVVTDVESRYDNLRQAADRLRQIRDAVPPFTVAQRDTAIQDLARIQLRLIRSIVQDVGE